MSKKKRFKLTRTKGKNKAAHAKTINGTTEGTAKIERPSLTRIEDINEYTAVESINDEAKTNPHLTYRSNKSVRLDLEHETSNGTNSYDEPDISPNLSSTHLQSQTNSDTVISAWCESLLSKLKEFDDCTRSFCMKQIDSYVLGAKLQRMKCEKQDEKIYIDPIQSLYLEVPSTSESCKFAVKAEVVDNPAEIKCTEDYIEYLHQFQNHFS